MKRAVALTLGSLAVLSLLAWMLATPISKINHTLPAVADGNQPVPPPPFAAVGNTLVADGNQPVPPPPFAAVGSTLVADGNQPVPPPPFSFVSGPILADGNQPVPPPPFAA